MCIASREIVPCGGLARGDSFFPSQPLFMTSRNIRASPCVLCREVIPQIISTYEHGTIFREASRLDEPHEECHSHCLSMGGKSA